MGYRLGSAQGRSATPAQPEAAALVVLIPALFASQCVVSHSKVRTVSAWLAQVVLALGFGAAFFAAFFFVYSTTITPF